ncbi:MAG: SMP-30/gluconolactonase/LRE family protein [Gammaproteobacteria bacterium]|nr:SMP-30/gluconolactonase/LRE family protein [Gammaproteobacteria bacterium]
MTQGSGWKRACWGVQRQLALALMMLSMGCATHERQAVEPAGELTVIPGTYQFTEGPAVDADGNVYFTDIPASRIHFWNASSGSVRLHRADARQANGLMFDTRGHLVVCEMEGRRVVSDDLAGNLAVLADSHQGSPLHMPNDLWIDRRNGVYFSDFLGPDKTVPGGLQVHYIEPRSSRVIQVTADLIAPNGVIGTADGKWLYVTDPGAGATYKYRIAADGTLRDRVLFARQATDGMAIDEYGNLYMSGERIVVYSAQGRQITQIALPQRSSNLKFAGADRRTLFITAGTAVYTVPMKVRGAPTTLDLAMARQRRFTSP